LEKRRVVITGMGIISPVGTGLEENWNALMNGKSGIDKITHFDTTDFSCKIAGQVRGFDPHKYIDPKEAKKMDTFIQYAVAASCLAMEDSGLKVDDEIAERVGVIVGSGIGGMPLIEKNHKIYLEKGPKRISPFFIPQVIINLAPGQIAMKFNAKGPNSSVVTACATSNHSIGEAFRTIQRGEADVMIAGGTESVITPLAIGGFCSMRALSSQNDEPAKASRPFDLKRDGFIMGEGSGILVFEELEFAKKRGARIRGEIIGYGQSCDAYHITSPSIAGEGAVRCMRMALEGVTEPVDYLNTHGTSTPQGDIAETQAVKAVFGDQARRLVFGSTKSMTGHQLGAAGGVEFAVCALAIDRGVVPPTINYRTPDPECDLDCAPNQAVQRRVDVAMSNSFGFGGHNVSVVLKRFTA